MVAILVGDLVSDEKDLRNVKNFISCYAKMLTPAVF